MTLFFGAISGTEKLTHVQAKSNQKTSEYLPSMVTTIDATLWRHHFISNIFLIEPHKSTMTPNYYFLPKLCNLQQQTQYF